MTKYCLLALIVGMGSVRAAENLIVDGTFDATKDVVPASFRCTNSGAEDGSFRLYTEDLTWNKCGQLVAGKVCTGYSQGMPVDVSSAFVKIGGTKSVKGVPVEPNTVYEYSFDVKSAVIPRAIFNVNEYEMEDGQERLVTRKLAGPGRYFDCRSDEWKNIRGIYRTGDRAVRVELTLQIWTMTGGRADADKSFQPGDFLLLDNVSFSRDERSAKVNELLSRPPAPVVVAPFSPMSEPACPFLPVELADAPTQIVFRAAVNEQKPLPIAIANFTENFQQFRVVLESEPEPPRDNGAFGLRGFPAEKITVREALRFRDTDQAPESVRYDPLVEMNAARVLSVPAKEAGAVWFDFDTRDVRPGTYRGRLRVIPLGLSAKYQWRKAERRYDALQTSEVILPVTFIVDPIVLSREAVRPGHFCSPCQSEQGFQLECDLGGTMLALDTKLFVPEAVGNRESAFHRTVADYLAWGRRRGVGLKFFIKYNAYGVAQNLFNRGNVTYDAYGTPQGKRGDTPESRAVAKAAWERYVHLMATLMTEAGVPFEDYYVLVQDEPKYENLEWVHESQAQLKALYPKMQTYVSCGSRIRGKVHFLDVLGDNTDLWMIGEDTYNRPDEVRRFKELKAQRGVVLAFYRCKTWMKAPLSAYFRRNSWRGEYLGFDADMLYQFAIWNRGVRGEMSFKFVPQGELSYQADGRFFPSVRYMAYREGVTDAKYLQALREKRGNEPAIAKFLAQAVEDVVVRDPESLELPAQKREQVRKMLLDVVK